MNFPLLRRSVFCLTALFCLTGRGLAQSPADSLDAGFADPPTQARPMAWWHWINGNVTKEGIDADLENMKRVGLAGAQMIDVEIYLPPGPARYGSDLWNDCIQHAIRTADRLGLEFDMANADGWSASAGPWITPALSMKKVVWSETPAEGPFDGALPQPPAKKGFYADAAVFAVPADPLPDGVKPVVSVSGQEEKKTPHAKKSAGGQGDGLSITWTFPSPVSRRLIVLEGKGADVHARLAGRIECSKDGVSFHTVGEFDLNGGMGDPSKVALPFPRSTGTVFRLVLDGDVTQPALDMERAQLSDAYRTGNFFTKSVSATLASVLPDTPLARTDADAIPADKVINLTSLLKPDGHLQWTPPAGRWTILRMGYTTTGAENHPAQPEGHGLEVDKMDPAALRFQFDHALSRVIRDAGPFAGHAFTGLLLDSWEAGQQNWTPKFPEEFKTRRGYDLTPYLPALAGYVIESPAVTDAVLSDFRRTVSDLVSENYFGGLRKLANANRLKFYAEPYGGVCFNEFHAGEEVDVSMGEFWVSGFGNHNRRIKKMSSLTHTLGRTILAAESFTAKPEEGRWLQAPVNLKPIGDLAFVQGLNRMILHTYVHQPMVEGPGPGFTLGRYGTHFGRLNTWWPYAKPWVDYLARSQFLLQQGHNAADFLALLPDQIDFLVNDDEPKLPKGYNFDFIAPRQLLGARVENGRVVLPDGASYRAILLPKTWTADTTLLTGLAGLAAGGVPIVGPAPVEPASLRDLREDQSKWEELRKQLWGGDKPSVRAASDLPAVAKAIEPDFVFQSAAAKASLGFIHRTAGDADIYFLANPDDKPLRLAGTFRIAGKEPELWDAVSGRTETAPAYRADEHGVTMDIELSAGGSTFVIFRHALPARRVSQVCTADGTPVYNLQTKTGALDFAEAGQFTVKWNNGDTSKMDVSLPAPVTISSPWKVTFQPPGRDAFTRDFPILEPWNKSTDPQVKYFSGSAKYETKFSLPSDAAGLRCSVDLGRVCDIAEVRVNGKSAGVAWTAPFSVDITSLLQPGENSLEVSVANRWVNRLVGDEQFPPDAKYQVGGTKFTIGKLMELPDWLKDPKKMAQRQRQTFATWKFYDKDSPLLDSGLLGPVTIRFAREVPLSGTMTSAGQVQ